MSTNTLKCLVAAGGLFLSVASLPASPAQAVGIITYDFKVTNLTGVLAGKDFNGSFSFNDVNFQGQGDEYVSDPMYLFQSESGSLIDFEFNILGRTFTFFDDEFRRTSVYFMDGVPTSIYYRAGPTDHYLTPEGGSSILFWMRPLGSQNSTLFRYMFDEGGFYSEGSGGGDVIFSKRVSTPEPATLGGLSVLGLGLLVSRKKKTQKSA
ncbi:PEP-CTERM sorting domain-containing protein [Leptolyngbya sp. ST-U4]|uniref:PEP-CTERM sorting domain-containing protein n=1 Tax=Leptolyngbya sp. ST-U4 TaxID=2933912 RepID=UPI0032992A94